MNPPSSTRSTINDVARAAGVSKATVSAVLNESSPVSAELRLRVLDAVEALDYRPTRGTAAARAGGRGRSIGVLVKELDNPYFAGVIAGVRAHADAHGYAVLVSSSERDPEAERQAVALLTAGLTAGDVAGLIVTPVIDDDADLSHLFELKRRQVPFVLLGGIRGVRRVSWASTTSRRRAPPASTSSPRATRASSTSAARPAPPRPTSASTGCGGRAARRACRSPTTT
jgi:DNA-binding LacI/PurR family transcriptional regulator